MRRFYKVDFTKPASKKYRRLHDRTPVAEAQANAVSSELTHGRNLHAPAIDVDHPCRLLRSSTPGHFHLYVDVPMSWWRYRLLLKAMVIAGIVEPGYYRASVQRGATFLRKPGVYKGVGVPDEVLVDDLLEIADDTRSD